MSKWYFFTTSYANALIPLLEICLRYDERRDSNFVFVLENLVISSTISLTFCVLFSVDLWLFIGAVDVSFLDMAIHRCSFRERV